MTRSAALALILLAAPLAVLPAAAQGSLSKPATGIDMKAAPGSFSALAKRLMPAVVNISTEQVIATGMPTFPEGSPAERFNEYFGRDDDGFQRQGSLGSGFVISADGYIVTNNHVIEKADTITITFSDGRELQAKLVGRDQDSDLAVLKVASSKPLPFVELADSDAAVVGDWVIAIGNPLGFGGSVSAGIISATGRDLNTGRADNYIQTDAAINQGNSGGPMFSMAGEVLGVVSHIISKSGGFEGLGFVVASNVARELLLERGAPWHGIDGVLLSGDLLRVFNLPEAGVLIQRVVENSFAARLGLRGGFVKATIGDRTLIVGGDVVLRVQHELSMTVP